jgi:putative YphP/YqiW family bacilliredoxin
MRYPEEMVRPMREEMVRMGFEELRTPEEVRRAVEGPGTALLFVNSVCGCAGSIARPGIALALAHGPRPERLGTTFAGMDLEATEFARSLFRDHPPSSPQLALFKDGEVVAVVQRHQIEGITPEEFSALLVELFERHCRSDAPA